MVLCPELLTRSRLIIRLKSLTMLKVQASDAEIYLGTNAGLDINSDLVGAEHSVLVVSPYLSKRYVKLLLKKKREQHLDVVLITSTDFEKQKGSEWIYRMLVKQHRHTSEKPLKLRIFGLWTAGLTFVLSLAVAVTGFYLKVYVLLWALVGLPIGLLIKYFVDKIRVYSYTYSSVLPFYVTASPYSEDTLSDQVLVHSKLYIVDGRIAYIGSANFTRSGFEYNYESIVKITDSEAIKQIQHEIDLLLNDQYRLFRSIDTVGQNLYPEPVN